MALAPNIANLAARAGLDAITATIGTSGLLRIYSGTMPTDTDTALSGNTILAELPLSATAFAASTDANPGALATANAITADTSADNTGTASFFRFLTSAGVAKIQGSAGTATADMILNSVAITAGSTVSVSSATVTLPEG